MERIIDAAFAAKRRVSRDRASSSPKDPRSSEKWRETSERAGGAFRGFVRGYFATSQNPKRG
jgi:hypothetical protein